jgi:hypothetical protein
MPLLVKVRSFLRNLLSSRSVEADLEQEVHAHLEMLVEENICSGMSPLEAQRAANIELGGIEQVKERVREERIGNWLHSVLSDCRYGVRQLRKNPGFAAVAVLTLALGIGANTAIFSVVQGVLLAPLPYREPDRLVTVWLNNFRLKSTTYLSYRDFMDWERADPPFEKVSAYASRSFDLSSPGNPEHLEGREISSNFLSTLGVGLAMGREFSAEEDRYGGAPVAIISNGLWRDRLGGSALALG